MGRGARSSAAGLRALLLCSALCLPAGARSGVCGVLRQSSATGAAASYERALALAAEQRLEEARVEAAAIEDALLRAQAGVYVHFLAADYAGALPLVAQAGALVPDREDLDALRGLVWLAERGAAAALFCDDLRAARENVAALATRCALLPPEEGAAWQEAARELEAQIDEREAGGQQRRDAVARAKRAALGLFGLVALLLTVAARRA